MQEKCSVAVIAILLVASLLATPPERAAGEEPETASGRPPNIVFVLIDDMGWVDPACYGHPFHETPAIDRLASEGVRFTRFYAASPVCSSTRASIQSGQYPARVGITDFIPGHLRPFEKLVVPPIEKALPLPIETPGECLRKAGYATGYFGKWHLGGKGHGPADQGYDTTEATVSKNKEFRARRSGRGVGPKRMDVLTDQALWFIEKNKDRPFFVTLSHHAVHIPLEASEEDIDKYEQKARPATGVNHPVYAAMVEYLDRSIGKVLGRLEALGLSEETAVIFTSDNGGLRQIYTGRGEVVSTNAPLRDEKGTLYEGGIRVPMIVRWPGVVPPGTTCTELATTADLLPTFCEIAGAERPGQPIDGTSLVGLFRRPTAGLTRNAIYFHYPHYHHSRPAGAILSGNWKLHEFFDTNAVELYDLVWDPGEQVDLSVRHRDIAEKLRGDLRRWREAVGARMPKPNPDFDEKRRGEWWNRGSGTPLNAQSMEKRYKSRRLPQE